MMRAKKGYTFDACHGCGQVPSDEKGRPKLGVCSNCEKLLELARHPGEEPANLPITILDGLSTRELNCLRWESITTLKALCARDASQVMKIPNLGRKTYCSVQHALEMRGLAFGMNEDQVNQNFIDIKMRKTI